jgi:alanyl aminopeptidase
LHGRGLAVSAATLAPPSGPPVAARWEEVDPLGVVRVTLPVAVSGDVVLRVVFEAAYDAQLVGVYRVPTSAGPAVFSKFEAIYARRAFPCFDEPAFKIPYDITLTVPAASAAISNMPVVSETASGAATRQVRFATTPPLPSYLVMFAVGPYEMRGTALPPAAQRAAALPIRAVALHGRGNATAYALGEAMAVVGEQERYFGIAFPYPKLDLVAVPDFQSGAMENAGAITFRDSALLVDDKITSLEQRIGITSVIAHEIAHQWFGDLVTMPWWDDLWLNEGFATFLATKTMRNVRPQLEAELEAVVKTNTAMRVDGLATARRIRQPIETAHDITNAFDGITYDKGAAVLTMVEHFIGDEPFRRGLHDYLAAHAGGNAKTEDLIQSLAAAAGRPLAPLVSSFLDQPGVPVVSARLRCEAGRGHVDLEQTRWLPIGSSIQGETSWTIPVCIRVGIGKRIERACTLLDARTGSLDLPACADWILPNADAAGYYQATLATEDLTRLRDRGLPRLSTVERVRVAYDLTAGFRSAALAGDDVLNAMVALAGDPHGAVAGIPLALLVEVDEVLIDPSQRPAMHAHIARLYARAVRALGWAPAADDKPWRRLFRQDLLETLALKIEDPAVLGEAARLGRRVLGLDRDHVRHPDAVSPDLADLVVAAAARAGGAEVFNVLVADLAGSEDAQVRERILRALASARDPELVGSALDLSIDPRLRKSERISILMSLLHNIATRDTAWSWLKSHFDALMPLLPDRFGGRLPLGFLVCDAQRAEDLRAFLTPRVEQLAGGPRNLAQALEIAQQCIARVKAQRDSVERYVRALPRP